MSKTIAHIALINVIDVPLHIRASGSVGPGVAPRVTHRQLGAVSSPLLASGTECSERLLPSCSPPPPPSNENACRPPAGAGDETHVAGAERQLGDATEPVSSPSSDSTCACTRRRRRPPGRQQRTSARRTACQQLSVHYIPGPDVRITCINYNIHV